MKVCFVAMRYGPDVLGGAEQHCRNFAIRMAARGHQVEVVTTTARSSLTWADDSPSGTTPEDGVLVHRLPTTAERDPIRYEPLERRAVWGARPVPLALQEAWLHAQGPDVPGLAPWLSRNACRFDVVVCFSFMYATTVDGLIAAGRHTTTVLHPTAHDEPVLDLSLYDIALAHADGWALSTEEEADLVTERFRPRGEVDVIGVGIELGRPGDGARFRGRYGLGEDPYLVVVGRAGAGKGVDEVLRHHTTRWERAARSGARGTRLVVVGDELADAPEGVVGTGFVDDQTRDDALAGATAVVVPSWFESFSMVLAEGWAQRRPAIVQERCAPLRGQVARAGGGVAYRGFREWDQAADLLTSDRALADRLGSAGRRYVEDRYPWDTVLDRYEALLTRTMAGRADRPDLS